MIGRLRGDAAVVVLALGMAAAVAAAWLLVAPSWPNGPIVPGVPAPLVLVLVVVAELCTVDVFLHKETHSISLRAIPLVAGLFVLAPPALLAVVLLGVGGVLVVKARQSHIKLLFNVALLAVEVTVALTVFHALLGPYGVDDPRAWIAAMAAALAVDLVCALLITVAIRVHDPEVPASPGAWLTIAGAIAAVTNATVALVAVILFDVTPAAPLLLVGIAAALFAAYRAFVSLRQRHSELEVLSEFTAALSHSLTGRDVAEAALREAQLRLEAERAELWLLTDSDGRGRRITLKGDSVVEEVFEVPITSRLWGRLVSDRAPVVVGRGDRDPLHRRLLADLECADLAAAPLTAAGGVNGIILLREREGEVGTFGASDARVLSAVARYTSIALEKGRLVDEVTAEAARREHDALHDQLTGLPNRRQLLERVEDRLTGPGASELAILLFDVDDFKEVNDTFGHAAGDEILVEIARRLGTRFEEPVVTARLGGDEFAVLVPGVRSTQEALRAAEDIGDALGVPQQVNGVSLHLHAAIGIAMHPLHGTDAATLLRYADVAMYQAKSDRRTAVVYDPSSDSHTPERVALAADLRAAIAADAFGLGYQPIQHLASGHIIGVEVLARWVHPTRGLLPPPIYVEVAEQSDLIRLLTGYVLRRALEQRNAWMRQGLDLRVSVNVSVHDLHRDGFADEVLRLLDGTGTPRGRLLLELTETQALHHPERIAPVLERLRDAGVVIAIDDFGTGYSSITSLRSLPVDEIKIDKSFVSNMIHSAHDEAIVGSLIDLASRLDIEIVAEGVEDDATRTALAELGCQCIQGYVLTPALDGPALARWVAEHHGDAPSAAILPMRPA